MLVNRNDSAFEICIYAVDGEWEGKIIEYNMLRLLPTLHLQHRWTSQEAAIAGVQRRWQRLFPDDPNDPTPDMAASVTTMTEPATGVPGLFSHHPLS
jgi:hypothetical protein